MLRVKALPEAPEETERPPKNVRIPYRAAFINFFVSIVFFVLSLPFWWYEGGYLFLTSLSLACTLFCTGGAIMIREAVGSPLSEDTILRRSFFVIGITLLFPSFCLAIFLYLWKPEPFHAAIKPKMFSFGSYQRLLYQDSTPIPQEERVILGMTDAEIDLMMPMELYLYFLTLEEPTFSYNFIDNYEAVKDTYRIWITVNIILFLLAVSSIVVSFCLPKQIVVVTGWSGNEW